MKSVMGDLTDSSNRAEGMGLIPAIWSCGAAIGYVAFISLSKHATDATR